MAVKTKKGLRGSIDDVLSDLLGDEDDVPLKSTKPASFGDGGGRSRGITSQISRKGPVEDDIFSKMALEGEGDIEEPDLSDVNPEALLETLKDMDEMEADLLGIKKASSGPVQKSGKNVEKSQPLAEPARSAKKTTVTEKGDAVSGTDKNMSSAPTISRHVKKKFSFEDLDDPLADLLSDEEEDTKKKVHSSDAKNPPETNAEASTEKGLTAVSQRKREEVIFEDDGDNLMDAMGFGESSKGESKSGRTREGEEPRPARTMLDELLGRGTGAKLLERPSTGDRKEFKLDKINQKQAGNYGGNYQPSHSFLQTPNIPRSLLSLPLKQQKNF